jgi:HK97 gp10 family phage protein
MSATLSVTGIKEIDDLLKGLPKQLTHRVLQAAHADAAKPLINAAQAYAPYRTGKLERSIGAIKPSIHKATEIGIVKVGPRRGGSYKGYHGHLIEYGHRIVTRKGKTVGRTSPKPFMEPAFNVTKAKVEANIADSIAKKLLGYMRRTIKNNA